MRNGSRIIAAIILSFFFYCNVSAAEVPAVQDSIQVKILEQAGEHVLPTPYMVIPFILLLLMIATGPLFYKHFWETLSEVGNHLRTCYCCLLPDLSE